MRTIFLSTLVVLCVFAFSARFGFAQGTTTPADISKSVTQKDDGASSTEAISPGTAITMANWRDYRAFMPDVMISLFEGTYFWKMPSDVRMEIGPTVIHPLPRNYLEATEKYSGQVKLIELPSGGLSLEGYHGGIPFPSPSDPHKGWKVLMNHWYRYMPHLIVDSNGYGCSIAGGGSVNCQTYRAVKHQLSFSTDPGLPPASPSEAEIYFTEWYMTVEPEQDRYTTVLTVDYADLARPEQLYVFLPSLRRYQALSSKSRCAPSQGMDFTPEDFHNGFDSNMTEAQADYLSHKKILALVDASPPPGAFPQGYDMPLGWPTPSWGKWQVRDVDVISVQKIPSKVAGYCYGRRVMYLDSHFYGALWKSCTTRRCASGNSRGFSQPPSMCPVLAK